MYKIVRFYANEQSWRYRRTILNGLTLEQAQAHCSDPNTSSSTTTLASGKRRTKERGPWFDGYTECDR